MSIEQTARGFLQSEAPRSIMESHPAEVLLIARLGIIL